MQNYAIGIKYDTTDLMIESIDPIFVYKELHNIHNIQRKNLTVRETVSITIDIAKAKLREYRDLLRCLNDDIEDEFETTVTANDGETKSTDHDDDSTTVSDMAHQTPEQEDASTTTQSNEQIDDSTIIQYIIDHATSNNVTIKLADLQGMTTHQLQQELKRLKQGKTSIGKAKKERAYHELSAKAKTAQNLYGVNSQQFDPTKIVTNETPKNDVPAPREDDTNEE